jgi:Fe-S-cluster containining protein
MPKPKGVDAGACPHLAFGKCTAYDSRPLVCRLYGVAEGLRCEHGCEPDRLLTDKQTRRIIAEAGKIGGPIGLLPASGQR